MTLTTAAHRCGQRVGGRRGGVAVNGLRGISGIAVNPDDFDDSCAQVWIKCGVRGRVLLMGCVGNGHATMDPLPSLTTSLSLSISIPIEPAARQAAD